MILTAGILAAGSTEPSVPSSLWVYILVPGVLVALWALRHLPRLITHAGDDL